MPLFGHRQLLAQAVSNLIENAIRYGSAGGEIRIGVQAAANADPGRGGRPRAWNSEPNVARKRGAGSAGSNSSRSEEGAGLGLALAEAIAHLHEGKLLLEDNAPGLLTALELPVRSRPPISRSAAADDRQAVAAAAPSPR